MKRLLFAPAVARLAAPLLCAALLGALPASASIFLNGVNIDGVVGQTFEGCTVTIDEKGNVLITAKGYEVQTSTPKPATPAVAAGPVGEPVTKRYFLVTEQPITGMAQYDVDVFINSVWVKRVSSDEPQAVVEVTKYMHKGKNSVHMTATKNLKEGRKSTTPQHTFTIHLGEGNVGGNNVMIDNALLEYSRNAADLQNHDDEYTIVGR